MPESNKHGSEDKPSKFELSNEGLLETTFVVNNVFPMNNDAQGSSESNRRDDLPFSPNDCIGRYTVIKTLGSGGFGIVYLAHDKTLGRKVAIKVSRSLDGLSEKLRTSLVDEARAAASLDHPNIIRVFDVDQWQNRTYVVMELVEGKSLADVIARQETISLARVTGIMRQIALALEQLHAKGIIHRDLKPANILITENEQVKVTDLGLALTDDSPLWNKNHIAGTQRYMAPEQVLGEVHRIDGRTDIWAFGVVVFEMLTLQSPFRTNDQSSVFSKILNGEIASPRQRRPEIPDNLERLCLKCLSKRMSDRFQSAKQLSEAISKIEADAMIYTSVVRAKLDTANESNSVQIANNRNPSANDSHETRPEKKSSTVSELSELRGLVPRGLRAFSAEDSSYFYRLIPGPYDIEGRPAILNYWLKWIENSEQNSNNSVGVLYGASGCGKSSFVLASLIPSLSASIKTIYFDFTVQNPVRSLVQLLHERFPQTKSLEELPQIFGAIRSRDEPYKVLLVFDQFEQYLIDTHIDLEHVMVQSLRQCNGTSLQAIMLVRDEFWSEISQFMQMLELSLSDGVNAANHPLMNKVHARRVLESFGRAYEMLPSFESELTASQRAFIDTAIDGMAQDETVLCVRIAMFAELMKNYAWEIQTIVGFGGVDGAVSRFLTDAFHSQNSPMSRRSVANDCIEILRALLPVDDRELKSAAKSLSELARAANGSNDSVRFTQAIRCLEVDLRIISPTTTANSFEQHFNLAHDYLVRPIQNWHTAQDNSTWKGRARQRLSMIASRYQRKPSRDNLLGVWDWLLAAIAVSKARRNEEQSRVMRASGMRAVAWLSAFGVGITLIAFLGVSVRTESIRAFENQRVAVNNDIYSFLNTKSSELETLFRRLQNNHRIAKKDIVGLLPVENPNQKRRQVLLKGLLGAKVAMEDIDESVSESDLGELDLWKSYLNNKSHRDVVSHYLQDKKYSNSFAEWQWLFLVQQDYRLLQHIMDADDPAVEAYKVLAFAAQDESPFLNSEVRASVARNLIESGKANDITYHTKMNLATHIIGLDALKKVLVPEPLLDYLESTKTDKQRFKAMTAQWFLSIFEGSRVIAPPSEPSEEWRIDEPIQGLPFAMIRVPEGVLTYEITGDKGKKKFGIVMADNVWMAREEVSCGLIDAYFEEFPKLRDMDWPSEVSNDLCANKIDVPIALQFCNWLSEKDGLEKVYAVESNGRDQRKIENFPKYTIDIYANGYRLPTFDEFRYAGIHGDYEGFWTRIATKEMLSLVAPLSNDPMKTYRIYPNAWGFQGVTGSLREMVVDSKWNIALARTNGGQIETWNNPVPYVDEQSSKLPFAGFRIVQGAIENRPRPE